MLIDPEGRVAGRDLKADRLNQILRRILAKN